MSTAIANTEADIFTRMIAPNEADLSPDAARSILKLHFSDIDRERMHELAEKSQEGSLTPADRTELDRYERVGTFLGILQSKARVSLRQSPASTTISDETTQ